MTSSGGGKYEVNFWWDTPHSQVVYQICSSPTFAEQIAVTVLGCESKAQSSDGGRVIESSQIFVHQPSAAAPTDARATILTCLTGFPCGSTNAVAGIEASFVIQAMDARGLPQFSGTDNYTVTLVGPEQVVASVRHLRLNYYEYVRHSWYW